jgi:hypothetical protein
MAVFTQIDLIAYIQRIELQKDILPLATVFTLEQKQEIEGIYEQLLSICQDAFSNMLVEKLENLSKK